MQSQKTLIKTIIQIIDDPTYLYVSDKKGNNFKQLTPDNYNITSWDVVKGTSKIILQAQKDSNGDKKLDGNDEVIPLIVDVNTGKLATETFNQNYIDSLKQVLTNTWKINIKKQLPPTVSLAKMPTCQYATSTFCFAIVLQLLGRRNFTQQKILS